MNTVLDAILIPPIFSSTLNLTIDAATFELKLQSASALLSVQRFRLTMWGQLEPCMKMLHGYHVLYYLIHFFTTIDISLPTMVFQTGEGQHLIPHRVPFEILSLIWRYQANSGHFTLHNNGCPIHENSLTMSFSRGVKVIVDEKWTWGEGGSKKAENWWTSFVHGPLQ